MKMPIPIANKFTKMIIVITAVTLLGVVLGISMRDQTMILLSLGVALAGGVKAFDFHRTVKDGRFECLTGQLLEERAALTRKRHTITLSLEDGLQVQKVIEGRYHLQVGAFYSFYLKRDTRDSDLSQLPEMLQPAHVVLGLEEHGFSSGKQI